MPRLTTSLGAGVARVHPERNRLEADLALATQLAFHAQSLGKQFEDLGGSIVVGQDGQLRNHCVGSSGRGRGRGREK